jgi:hypothetical protein
MSKNEGIVTDSIIALCLLAHKWNAAAVNTGRPKSVLERREGGNAAKKRSL